MSAQASPCLYRYIVRGRTFCALAIQESRYTLSEVIPPTCAQCPIPAIIAEHACARMNLGVEISVFGGRQNVEMHYASCEVTVERLVELEECAEGRCPFWEAYDEEAARQVADEARKRQVEREARRGE